MAVDVESGAAQPTKTIALTENPGAPPRDITLVENPKAPISFLELKEGPGAGSKAAEDERRHDVAVSLLGKQREQDSKRGQHAVRHGRVQTCKVRVDLPLAFCTVYAAGIIGPRFELHDGTISHCFRRSTVFNGISHLIMQCTARGATDRNHSWAQKAGKQTQSAHKTGVSSIVARWDVDERLRKHLLNTVGGTTQSAERLQWERHRRLN